MRQRIVYSQGSFLRRFSTARNVSRNRRFFCGLVTVPSHPVSRLHRQGVLNCTRGQPATAHFLPSISWAPAKAVGIGSPMSPVERAGNHESPGVASSIASATKVNDALSGQEDRMHAMRVGKRVNDALSYLT